MHKIRTDSELRIFYFKYMHFGKPLIGSTYQYDLCYKKKINITILSSYCQVLHDLFI